MIPIRVSLVAMPLILVSLSACAPAPTVPTETMMETHIKTIPQQRRAAMFARIESEAAGIPTGTGAPNKAFVFFDPHCSYCSDLWRATRSLEDRVDFVWVPVSTMGADSAALGALMLDAARPLDMMAANERSMKDGGKPIEAGALPSAAALTKVQANTELMSALDPSAPIQAVPLTYYRPATGSIEVISGALDARALASAFKLR